jgi:tripartite ATP-independent transporter DctM subunit
MLFAGISGSSTADAAGVGGVLIPAMKKQGYDARFTVALTACASVMGVIIPPSILMIVWGGVISVSIGGLFLAGVLPGVMIGVGLMIYSFFFGPIGILKKRASAVEVFVAARGSALPLIIPVIIMGGILTGWFTPTEAGMVAAAYILFVLIPVFNPRHFLKLPTDFMYTGVLYSLPLALVAAASAFGWMLAYLRGPDAVAEYISFYAGTDPRMIMFLLVLLFIVVGDFIDAVPAIIIFMPIINKLTDLGNIKPVHMGVLIVTTLVFGLITPPYGLCLLVASKFVGVPFYRAMFRSLPLYIVFLVTIGFVLLLPDAVLWLPKTFLPQSVGCFPNPSGAGWICPP